MSFSQRFGAQSRRALLLELWAAVAVLGYFDFLTTWELSLFVFYAVPIFAAAWYLDRTTALAMAGACGVAWGVSNAGDHPYLSSLAFGWAALNRTIYFFFVAVGGSALAAQTESIRTRLESLERNAHLESELVRASEREQRRIGQDLHDGLCQTLAAIGFAVTSLREDLDGHAPQESKAAEGISRMVREAISEARGMARGIFPVQMNEVGLSAALAELVETTRRLRRIEVVFESRGEVQIADAEVGMHLYRIAQEALNNAVTHAQASRIAIACNRDQDALRLTVSDDGTGLPPGKSTGRGMGLNTMNYRASTIGATLDFHRDPAGGTVVSCVLPAAMITHSRHATRS